MWPCVMQGAAGGSAQPADTGGSAYTGNQFFQSVCASLWNDSLSVLGSKTDCIQKRPNFPTSVSQQAIICKNESTWSLAHLYFGHHHVSFLKPEVTSNGLISYSLTQTQEQASVPHSDSWYQSDNPFKCSRRLQWQAPDSHHGYAPDFVFQVDEL